MSTYFIRKIRKKNDVIRVLQADLHQIEKFSDEHIRRTKSEAEKQEAADLKNSEGKKGKLQQEVNQLRSQLQNLIAEHRENEHGLRSVSIFPISYFTHIPITAEYAQVGHL